MGKAPGRLLWVDAAKGIGIVLVAIGHVWTTGSVRDAIYAFHMPLFFLLSGYTAHSTSLPPLPTVEFARRQWHAMAIPYIAFLLTLVLADQLIEHLRGHAPIFHTWSAAAWALLVGGSELRGPFTIFWFVPCLAIARLCQNGLSRLWPDPRNIWWLVTMAAALASGVWIGARSDFSPWGLLAVPVALVFLWLGSLWRTVREDRLWIAIALAAGIIALIAVRSLPLNMKLGDYGMPAFSLPLALLLSLGLCAVARLLALMRPVSALMEMLGRRSLVIMYLHVPVIHYAAPYMGKTALLALSLTLPLLAYEALARSRSGRRYFLGDRTAALQKILQ